MRRLLFLLLLTTAALVLPFVAAAAEGEPVHSVPPGVPEDDPDRARFRLDTERDPLRSFEDDSEGWLVETWKNGFGLGEPVGEPAELTSEAASHGERSVTLHFRFPRPTVLFKEASIGQFRYITYDVFVPAEASGRVRSLFFLKNKDGLWFQAISGRPLLRRGRSTARLSSPKSSSRRGRPEPVEGRRRDGTYVPGRSSSRLERGRWNTVTVDLRGGRSDLVPEGHLARWQERLAPEAEVLGFAVFGEERGSFTAHLDNLRGWTLVPDPPPALAVRNMAFPREGVLTFEKWEATFELTREFENPFDPDEVSVDAVIVRPTGEERRVPGFHYQRFARRLTPAGEELVPVGPGLWKVRYGPREPGPHAFRLEVKAGDESLVTGERTFVVTKGDHPGFVRVSERDFRAFEFDNGEPYYPIGHNVRSPTDNRCSQVLGWELNPDQGTFTFDRYFERMAAGGENFAEIWMASWWVGIEWTRDWKFYHGLGRYNLANAWRLDYLLARARELGLRVHLVIDNHGKYSAWCDKEWADSPYNARNRTSGGFLGRPDDFFTDDDAKRYYRNKARYIFARWGWDPTIMGFELVSELNLTGQRGGFAGRKAKRDGPDAPLRVEHLWHKEMIAYFRTVDQGRHIYTTHYSGDFNTIDPVMARLPEMDYVTGDGYRGGGRPFVDLARASGALSDYGKPYMITEYGGNWNGTSEAALEADIHSGLWGSYMTPAGGTPLLWWFEFVHRRDLYWHYAALSKFDHGEDRRDPDLRPVVPEIRSRPEELKVAAAAYLGPRRGYAWVYAVEPMTRYPKEPLVVEGVRVRFAGVENGPWRIQSWDTVKGEPIRTESFEAKDGALEVVLPVFANDVALKLRRAALMEPPEVHREPSARPVSRPITDVALDVLEPREAGGRPEFIRDWGLLGPFSYPPEKQDVCLDERPVEREPELRPRRGASHGDKEWRFVEADASGHVNLNAIFDGPDHVAAYAVAELRCPKAMKDVQLLVGSDDCVRVWLNGERVMSKQVFRGAEPDQDRVDISLRRGSNLLVLKVADGVGGWAFYCRLATKDGRTVPVGRAGGE